MGRVMEPVMESVMRLVMVGHGVNLGDSHGVDHLVGLYTSRSVWVCSSVV